MLSSMLSVNSVCVYLELKFTECINDFVSFNVRIICLEIYLLVQLILFYLINETTLFHFCFV